VDLPAVTAWETLRGALEYGNELQVLRRADLWGVWTPAEGKALRGLSEELISGTSVFINPNKHRWRLWAGGSENSELACEGAWSLIRDIDDAEGRVAFAALRSSGFEDRVSWVAKGTLWTFVFAPNSRGRELELAEEMTVATHRGRGLLANPHIHKWTCGLGNISLDQALRRLGHGRKEEKVSGVS
jgi:hypothetical protein